MRIIIGFFVYFPLYNNAGYSAAMPTVNRNGSVKHGRNYYKALVTIADKTINNPAALDEKIK